MEEIRIQRQQEEDKLRVEEEKRRNQEKQLQEKRKLETLKKALEEAEKKAKLEKEKRFSTLKQNINTGVSGEPKPKVDECVTTEIITPSEAASPTKSNRTYDVHSAKSQKKDTSMPNTEFNTPRAAAGPGNLNLYIHSVPPLALTDNQFNIVPIGINGNGEIVNNQSNGVQLAVLVPQSLSNSLYNVSLNSLTNISDFSDASKILTPRKYRITKTKDATTQTDFNISSLTTNKNIETEDLERNNHREYSNIDENAPQESHHSTLKKDRRFRSEERYKKDIENRPKWGVNRPAAQYKKQSEKDPFYSQKRKIRQKYRAQARQYLSQSSDDSRSPSPPTQSDKTTENNKTRNSLSQSYWRNKRSSQDIMRSANNETENSGNFAVDFNQIGQLTVDEVVDNKKSPKMSPTKRMTLSQKFINDKYGNRKLWIDETNEKRSKSNIFDGENRKKLIDQLNIAKRDYLDRNEDQDIVTKTKF